MTKIYHTIEIEGEDEDVWPLHAQLKKALSTFREDAEKDGKVKMLHEYSREQESKGLVRGLFNTGKKIYDKL